MAGKQHPPTAIIGAGAVGTSFAIALSRKGYPISAVISKSLTSARLLAERVKCSIVSTTVNDIPSSTRIIIVAVPDSSIPDVEKKLAQSESLRFKQLLVLHTSGIQPASIFKFLSRKDVRTAAVHPVQTFPKLSKKKIKPVPFAGIYFGVDCKKNVLPKVNNLLRDLNAKMIFVPERLRPLYHTACVFSSSYLILLFNAIDELSQPLHIGKEWFEIFRPLMRSAARNTVTSSAGNALTGPIIRGDTQTLQSHLHALKEFAPELIPFYTICGIEVARIAKAKNRITESDYNTIYKTLSRDN